MDFMVTDAEDIKRYEVHCQELAVRMVRLCPQCSCPGVLSSRGQEWKVSWKSANVRSSYQSKSRRQEHVHLRRTLQDESQQCQGETDLGGQTEALCHEPRVSDVKTCEWS